MMRSGWSWPNSRRQWMLLFLAQWVVIAAGIVALGLIVGSRDSSQVLTRVVVPALILVLVVVLCLAMAPLLFLLGRVRALTLALRFPDSLVINVSRTPELVSALEQAARIQLARGISFSMIADSTGLSFWDGMRDPRSLVTLRWAQIDKIEAGARKVRGAAPLFLIGGSVLPRLIGAAATASLAERGLSTAKVPILEGLFSVEFMAGDIYLQFGGGN